VDEDTDDGTQRLVANNWLSLLLLLLLTTESNSEETNNVVKSSRSVVSVPVCRVA
jgi:hypothetical protein